MRTVVTLILTAAFFSTAMADVPAPSNGIPLPSNYKYWRLLGVSHRDDNASLRAIVGNTTAMTASRKGRTQPWPDGTILGKLVWKDDRHPLWKSAIVPGQLSHIEFMVKDSKKYPETGGWGFARWVGKDLEPLNNEGGQPCFECHKAAAAHDYVFTRPAPLP